MMGRIKTCEWCGGPFEVTDDQRFFCSLDCEEAMADAEEDELEEERNDLDYD